MATVLVTGAGGASGVGAVRSLQTETDHEVVGVDANPTAAGIRLADGGTVVPLADDDDWPAAVAAAVDRFDVDAVIPTVDEELAELPRLREALPVGRPIVAPRQPVIDAALDKYELHQWLAAAGHDLPATWLASEVDDIDRDAYPVVVKPRRGRGSRGVQRLADESALRDYLARTARDLDDLLVQTYLEGPEYTTSVVGTRDGRLLSVVPKEAIEKDGSTVLGATRRAPAVADSCRAVFETLAPAGPMNVQQVLDAEGVPRTIEVNPRFSSTSCLTVAAGVDEFDLLVRDALGESVAAVDEYAADRYIVRYEDHVFVDDLDLGG